MNRISPVRTTCVRDGLTSSANPCRPSGTFKCDRIQCYNCTISFLKSIQMLPIRIDQTQLMNRISPARTTCARDGLTSSANPCRPSGTFKCDRIQCYNCTIYFLKSIQMLPIRIDQTQLMNRISPARTTCVRDGRKSIH